jgi:nicotinamide/nicotinate riboside kinase
VIKYARQHGQLPEHHSSHDHLNVQPDLPINPRLAEQCRTKLRRAIESLSLNRIILADGFLLYYDEAVRRQMDVRLFLRCKPETLEKRRSTRGGYATAEETVWQDPPGYFEHVVWPAYVLAHKGMFDKGDVVNGEVVRVDEDAKGDGTAVKNLTMIEAEETSIDQTVEKSVNAILDELHRYSQHTINGVH